MTAKNLGDILLEQGVIDRATLDRALTLQNRRLGEILIEEKLADPVAIASALKFQARSTQGQAQNNLSVQIRDLDEILQRVELIEESVTRSESANPVLTKLYSLRQQVESLLVEPVEPMLKKARFLAEKTAVELGKKVQCTFAGADLVIDRMLVEELSNMTLHLVRNAVFHGIETPELRTNQYKNPEGAVHISLTTHGGFLHLRVADDGAGIDLKKVHQKAVQKGYLSENSTFEQIDKESLCRILFTPGFSTVETVSSVSGRGVGLDAVEATAIRLGGEVLVDFNPGKGAIFTVKVPLRYVCMSVLPMRAGSQWVAIPASDVLSFEDAVANDECLVASELFGFLGDSTQTSENTPIVKDRRSVFWKFDEVRQPEYVLVRESSTFAKGAHGVLGGARLQDGKNMLLLDLEVLASILKPKKGPIAGLDA
ncbi:MAG: ATP-binding protein [Bdellovibrionota bacterium]